MTPDPTLPDAQQPEPERFAEPPPMLPRCPPSLPFAIRNRLRAEAVRRCRPA